MDKLDFFDIIRNSAFIYFIISNGFIPDNIDVENVNFWSETRFDIENIKIADEYFRLVYGMDTEDYVFIEFTTYNTDYFDNTELYFGRKSITKINSSYQVDDKTIRQRKKELGVFHIAELKYPIHIQLKKRNDHCVIEIKVLSRGWKEKDFAKPNYYYKGILTSSDVIRLLNPEKLILKQTFLPDSYSPRIDIQVEEKEHPLQRYFEQKALISYDGEIYDFGVFPNLEAGGKCDLKYEEYNSIYGSSILHIENCKKNQLPRANDDSGFSAHSITYRSESPEINFFKVDNKMFTKNEIVSEGMDLDQNYMLTNFVFGKAAIEEFGEFKYYQGVKVFVSK